MSKQTASEQLQPAGSAPGRGWCRLAVMIGVALRRAGESLAETLGRGTTCTGCCAA
jgi:hypothetical protein